MDVTHIAGFACGPCLPFPFICKFVNAEPWKGFCKGWNVFVHQKPIPQIGFPLIETPRALEGKADEK